MKTLLTLGIILTRLGVADVPNQQEWEKFTTPIEAHKKLAELAGKWNFELKWWTAPDTQPQVSKGKSNAKMILGGRFLQEDVTAKADGQDFTGIGLTGYDSLRQEYQSFWIDSMSTAMMLSNGKMDGSVLRSEGTMSDPMTNDKSKWYRTEFAIQDKNNHTYKMFIKDAKGVEFKMMEIAYKRAK